MESNNRQKMGILSLTLVVVTIGYGIVIPIFPFFIEKLGASGSHLGLLVATSALMELIFAPVWGGLSDRRGRKPILMLGVLGSGLSLLLLGLSTRLWMLFAARALSGILSAATLPTALAYVGDSTSQEDRGGGMGVLGAAMGLGVILGPGIGGWMGTNSLTLPFFVAAGLSLITLLLILILLPESLPPGARSGTSGEIKSIQVSQLWQALFSPIGILLFMIFLVSFGLTNFESIFGLYALEKFNYGPKRVGTILMVIGIVTTTGKGALTGPLTRRWGEAKVIKLSTLAGSVGFLVLLLANTYITILLATGFFILSKTLLRPAVLSLISRRATVGQGTAMGLSNAFMSLGRIIGPIWAGFAFDNNIHYPYLSGALIMLIGFLISLIGVSQENAPHYRQAVP